jgi:hypothetical protein
MLFKGPEPRARLVVILAALFAGAFVPAACTSETGEVPSDFVVPPCSSDGECSAGKYCAAGACKQDCVSGDDSCGAGMTCSLQGRCLPAVGAGGTGGTGSAGSGFTGGMAGTITVLPMPDGGEAGTGPDVDACASTNVDFTSEVPNVLLLVDRSGSMAADVMGGTSRWEAVRAALVDPTNGLVPRLETQVNLGLTLYTAPNGYIGHPDTVGMDDPDYIETDMCPYLVQVPTMRNNFAAIEAAYRPLLIRRDSQGQTPTGESLEAALPSLTGLDPKDFPGRRVIVLATDGEPDLCENGNDEAGGRARSVQAVQTAFDMGVTVYVISVGNDVGEQHLRELANLGQGFPADDTIDRFYRANDAMTLAMAFEDIVNGVRDCVFSLDGMVTGDGSDGTVTVDGKPLPFDDPDGWQLNDPSTVELVGSACELVKTGDHEVDITFPCDVIVPIPT